jgi:hypothetical protein
MHMNMFIRDESCSASRAVSFDGCAHLCFRKPDPHVFEYLSHAAIRATSLYSIPFNFEAWLRVYGYLITHNRSFASFETA